MAAPTLVAEIDFTGNPTAGYYDTLVNSAAARAVWRMNSAAALTDALGVNTGTFPSAPSLITGALPYDTDQGLRFNGSANYGRVPSSASLQEAGSYTVEGWLRFPTLPSALKPVFTKGSFRLEVTAANKLQFSVQNHVSGTPTLTVAAGKTVLVANTWYHVACVHDAGLGQIRLYLNGVLETTASHTAGTELWGLPLLFAARHSGTVPTFVSAGTILVHGGGDPTTSWPVPAPAGNAAGDLCIVHGVLGLTPTSVTLPTGFQTLVSYRGTNIWTFVAWKILAGGDSLTFAFPVNQIGQMVATCYRNIDSAQPFANPPYLRTGSGVIAFTGAAITQSDDTLVLGLASMARSVSWSSPDGTERYDTGGANSPGTGIAGYTSPVTTIAGKNFDMTSNGNAEWGAVWISLKGPDAQDFAAVDLDDWAFLNTVSTDDDVLYHYEGRLSGVGAWTDVSSDVQLVSSKFGRQYELNRMEAGTATVALRDLSRKYDPANRSSPYWPGVVPMRKIRVRILHNAVSYPVYRGFVERWPPRWRAPELAEVSVSCVDGFEPVALAGASGTLSPGPAGTQIASLLDQVPWPDSDRSIDAGVFVMGETQLDGSVKSYVDTIADSELGVFFFSADGVATFHDSAHRFTNTRSTTTQATFRDDGTGVAYQNLEPSFDKDNTINEWHVSDIRGEVASAVDEVSRRKHFLRTQDRATLLDTLQDAQTQAVALLQSTSKPGLRFDTLTVVPTTDPGWVAVLGIRISDRVTVVRNPVPSAGGSQYLMDCFVEGIAWELKPGAAGSVFGSVSFELSPVSSASYYDTIIRERPVSYWRMVG